MSILTAENLALSFGAFDLFKGISGAIANDGKIGLTVMRKGVKREVQPELAARSEGHTYWWNGSGDSDDRSKNLEPGPAPRVYRWKTSDDGDDQADLRAEIRQLKQDLEDLRTQMNSDKTPVKSQTKQPDKKQDDKK